MALTFGTILLTSRPMLKLTLIVDQLYQCNIKELNWALLPAYRAITNYPRASILRGQVCTHGILRAFNYPPYHHNHQMTFIHAMYGSHPLRRRSTPTATPHVTNMGIPALTLSRQFSMILIHRWFNWRRLQQASCVFQEAMSKPEGRLYHTVDTSKQRPKSSQSFNPLL